MKKLVKTILNGEIEMWYRWDDRFVGQRIALGKYESYLTRLFLEKMKKGLVVDVGANIGYYSLLAAGRGVKVWAIEPEEINFSILSKNMRVNGYETRIKLMKVALGERVGYVRLKKSERNFGAHRVVKDEGGRVKIVRLDDLIDERVEVLKIDVEGWEPGVIMGAKRLIKKWRPVMFLEFDGRKWDGDCEKMIRFLRGVYEKIYWVDDYVQRYFPVSDEWLRKRSLGAIMVKNDLNWEWGQVRDIRWKKWLKRILGRYPLT